MEGKQKCSCCKKELLISLFSIKKENEYYKTCDNCREKNKLDKRKVCEKEGKKEKEYFEDDKKRENRPKISSQKQQIILKEQNYRCRGPNKNDNEYYECDMSLNGKRFCDKKSSEPQFDHIVRWKEGGNGLENIQALCGNCHNMKTAMENIMNENKECPSERVKQILESLSKPKYQKIEDYSSESDEEITNLFVKSKLRRRY